jgi:chromosomal replication initiation ATPase DnaA
MDRRTLTYVKERNLLLLDTLRELEQKVKSLESHNEALITKLKDQESIVDFLRKENTALLPLYTCKLPKDKAIYFMNYLCGYYKFSMEDLKGNSRKGKLPYCRQVASYFLMKHFDWTKREVTNFLECDRTTIYHSIEKIEGLIDVDRSVLKDVLAHRDWLEKLNKI